MSEYLDPQVQYGDLKGKVEADGHDGPPLFELMQKAGGDRDRFFPAHASVRPYQAPNGEFLCSIVFLAADRAKYGPAFDDLERAAQANGGKLPVIELQATLPLADVLSHCKRLNLTVTDNGFIKRSIQFVATGEKIELSPDTAAQARSHS